MNNNKFNDEGLPVIQPMPKQPKQAPDGAVAICGVCGLRVMRVMGYSCSRSDCPIMPVATC